jgi:hypothetical protein
VGSYCQMLEMVAAAYPNLKVIAATLHSPHCLCKWMGSDCPRQRRRAARGASAGADSRSRGRRRFVCIRTDLRPAVRKESGMVASLRSRARSAGNDDSGRYEHRIPGRGTESDGRRRRAHRTLATRQGACKSALNGAWTYEPFERGKQHEDSASCGFNSIPDHAVRRT